MKAFDLVSRSRLFKGSCEDWIPPRLLAIIQSFHEDINHGVLQ